MDVMERIGLISEIARRKQDRRGRLGKTTVMKMLYLLQEALKLPIGYRFSLYTYGPYQSDVMSDIDIAEAAGAIEVNYDDEQGYKIAPGHANERFNTSPTIAAALDRVFETFGDMTARDLELRSTIHYLSAGVSDEQLVRKVREIKPKFSHEEIQLALREMRELGFLVGDGSKV